MHICICPQVENIAKIKANIKYIFQNNLLVMTLGSNSQNLSVEIYLLVRFLFLIKMKLFNLRIP